MVTDPTCNLNWRYTYTTQFLGRGKYEFYLYVPPEAIQQVLKVCPIPPQHSISHFDQVYLVIGKEDGRDMYYYRNDLPNIKVSLIKQTFDLWSLTVLSNYTLDIIGRLDIMEVSDYNKLITMKELIS